ncbi:MAG: 2-phosphosulfolactate phosphatase [Clostridia bacterium]|nr:2-phosphosulfolactate phosphatase [Clostridia bacterium]
MNIQVLQLIEGAKQARGITVIIDVFRAFSVEAYCFSQGAEKTIPIGDIDFAYKLKEENPDIILAGERRGKIMPGFDTGNSPSELKNIDVRGKTVVHTTSAGTKGIANAKQADEILGASLVNAAATARYIKNSGASEVSLVCMGLEALSETEEDTLCANYIKSLLEGTHIDMEQEIESLKTTSGAKFFDKAQNDIFPEADFAMCTELNKFNFVMRLKRTENGLDYMEKIEV